LHKAPRTALIKNTFTAENLSEMVKMEKINVPIINPNCTEEVKLPKLFSFNPKFDIRSFKTAFPANHKEVQQNWDKTITGNINFELIRFFKVSVKLISSIIHQIMILKNSV